MIKIQKKVCEVCNVEIVGFGGKDLKTNYERHLEQQHPIIIKSEEKIEELIEEVVEELSGKTIEIIKERVKEVKSGKVISTEELKKKLDDKKSTKKKATKKKSIKKESKIGKVVKKIFK